MKMLVRAFIALCFASPALAGLALHNRDNGQRRGRRTLRGDRVKERTMLSVAGVVAARPDPIFKRFYARLVAAGKPRKVAVADGNPDSAKAGAAIGILFRRHGESSRDFAGVGMVGWGMRLFVPNPLVADDSTAVISSLGIEATQGIYRPGLVATVRPGRVLLTGDARGADALNLYMRRVGEPGWRLLAGGCVKFPVQDTTPALGPASTEERAYRAVGLLDDEEIGDPSIPLIAIWCA